MTLDPYRMVHDSLLNRGDSPFTAESLGFRWDQRFFGESMKNELTFSKYEAFSRIIEVMSLMERAHELTPEDVRGTAEQICDLPEQPEQNMSMEEVVFWAGLATGMEVCRNFEEGLLDEETAEKLMTYSSLFAYSTRNAVVDLALQELEAGK